MDASLFEERKQQAAEWVSKVSGHQVDDFATGLKSGAVLCHLVNAIRPGLVNKITHQTTAFRQMENIDAFLKAADALGVPPEDRFLAEDLFYGNNIPKVCYCVFALAAANKDNTPELSCDDMQAFKEFALASQIDGKKRAASDASLSLFESGAKKSQAQASAASRHSDRMIAKTEKSVDTSGSLGFIDSNSSKAQKMISSAVRSGNDIIMSKDTAVASGELGFIDAHNTRSQKMISEAKRTGDDIIMSQETSVASGELGLVDSHHTKSQKMISEAKRTGDGIILSHDAAVASGELSLLDSHSTTSQKMISEAKTEGDHIVRY